jgi:hypothetical protein
MFFTFGFYNLFLYETTKNMKDKDTMTRSKYPRKMDEVMDAMDSMWLFGANPYLYGRSVRTYTYVQPQNLAGHF